MSEQDSNSCDCNENENQGRSEVNLQAHSLIVRLESEGGDVSEMADVAEEKMETLMRHSLRGEMEAIEREELSIFTLGDD